MSSSGARASPRRVGPRLDRDAHTPAMDGLGRAVGDGAHNVSNAIGGTLRSILDAGQAILPGPLLPLVVLVVAAAVFWILIKR